MAAGMNLTQLGKWIMKALTGEGESSNEPMTIEQALSYPPVFHCVAKITGAFGVMPLNPMRYSSVAKTKSVQENHSAYSLTRWRPNKYQTPSMFKRQMMIHALMVGNGRSFIRRESGIPKELIPLAPDRTISALVDGEKWHATIIDRNHRISIWEDMGNNPEKTIVIPDDDVLHIPGFSVDGVEGVSLLSVARRGWGIGIGAEKTTTKQQKKGYGGGLMLEAPVGAMRDEKEAQAFLKSFKEKHQGADGDAIGMLREGIKANVIQMNNTDAQFLETRRFQREDVALQFCLEGILGDSSNASYNSLEQRNLAYRMNCLAQWTVTWEEECELKLLTESERNRGFYFKFNDGALLRTEKQATMAFITQGIASTVLSPNEGREMLDLNPYDGGDSYENPNTSTSQNRIGGADNNPADPAKLPSNSGDKATQRMLAKLLKVESKRCQDHANSENFIDWMDDFYGEWESKLADEIEAIGGDRDLATEHCNESKRRLLEACECQPEQLAESITKCVSTWENRVNQLMEGLAKCSR